MSVTIKDVAQRAGVSIATVSRVINNSGPVNEATRQRVASAARELRYLPHGAARSLITRKTNTLGVLLPDLYGEFFSEVIRGIDQTARQSRYHLLVSSSHNDVTEVEAALRAMQGRVDGLIVMFPDVDAQALRANLPESLPVVLLNCGVGDRSYDSLNIDNFGGAYEVVQHLLEHGHRRVALIKGPERNHDARQRREGYRTALRDRGIERSAELEIPGDFTESAGYEAVTRILELEPRPTALFAANDSTAIGALSALREAGVRVPEEMAVAGFDDIPIARYMSPPLCTVQVAIYDLGARGVRRLLHAVESENAHPRRQETLPTALVVRRSCGCQAEE